MSALPADRQGKPNSVRFEIKDEWVYIDGKKTDWDWKKLVMTTFIKRISLSEHAHYTPPHIHFDPTKEKGHPFAYHVYGTAIITVTIDCLRGIYEIDSVKVVHDFGNSMNTDDRSWAMRRRYRAGDRLDDHGGSSI